MANSPWSEAEIAIIQTHIREGDGAISGRLELAGYARTSRAVEGYRKLVLGIRFSGPISVWTDERIEDLQALYAKGLSASQIARELGNGVTGNAVIGKLNRLGDIKPARAVINRELAGATRRVAARRPRPPAPTSEVRAFQFGFGVHSGTRTSPRRINTATPAPNSLNLRMWDDAFKPGCCKWSTGEDPLGYFFCGAPVEHGLPYCSPHARLAYNPTGAPPSAPKADRTAKAEAKDEPDPQPLDFEEAA